jgi:hypothetical protein
MFQIRTSSTPRFHLGEGNIRLLAALHLAGVHVIEGHDVVTHVVTERILVVVFRLKKKKQRSEHL